MEVPLEGNEVVRALPEAQLVGDDGEGVDEDLGSSPKSRLVGEENEIAGEVSGGAQSGGGEMEAAVGSPRTSSEPGIVAEARERRPSLDEVWESIKPKEGAQPLFVAQEPRESQEPQEEGEEKGGLSEAPQTASESQFRTEIQERVRPSSLRTRPSTRAKRNVTFKDDYEKVDEEKTHKPGVRRQTGGRQQKVPPACIGIFLAVVLASLIVYIASPSMPTKPVSSHTALV